MIVSSLVLKTYTTMCGKVALHSPPNTFCLLTEDKYPSYEQIKANFLMKNDSYSVIRDKAQCIFIRKDAFP